jgi:hypothetical protein
MKKANYLIMILAVAFMAVPVIFISCDKDDEVPATTINIDKTTTSTLDIGDTVKAVITIVTGEVKTFQYYKVVDEVKSDAVNAATALVQSGNTYTYTFSYVLQENDDLHTLGFEFELTDNADLMVSVALLVQTNLSTRSAFIKYDWKISEEMWLGESILAAHDAAKTFRFNEDGTYDVDLGVEHADALHHFCFWVFEEYPVAHQDTIAKLRLIRRLVSGETGADEYYDFRITSASESQMIMYWDIAFWGLLDIERTFTSQPKGAFQPYGTTEIAAEVAAATSLDCSNVDDNIMTLN